MSKSPSSFQFGENARFILAAMEIDGVFFPGIRLNTAIKPLKII
jgi:hypothetical protein